MSTSEGPSKYGKGLKCVQKMLFDILKKRNVEDTGYLPAIILVDFGDIIGLNTYPFKN